MTEVKATMRTEGTLRAARRPKRFGKLAVFGSLVRHDLVAGSVPDRILYGVALMCFVVVCALFLSGFENAQRMVEAGMATSAAPPVATPAEACALPEHFSLFDVLVFASAGAPPHDATSGLPYSPPFTWLVMQALIAALVGHYPANDLITRGPQVLTRVGGTGTWWLAKCTWIAATVAAFYLLGLAVFIVFAAAQGNVSGPASSMLSALLNGFSLEAASGMSNGSALAAALVAALVLSIALSLAQVTLSLIVGPLASFVALMAFDVASAYFAFPALFASSAILCRSSLATIGGTSPSVVFAISALIAVVSLIAGALILRRRDLLTRKESR
ncbi:hypothetical protein [Gordonibacter sp.]|nr:hypothetical protein [Gordonibacter sp.]